MPGLIRLELLTDFFNKIGQKATWRSAPRSVEKCHQQRFSLPVKASWKIVANA